MANRLTEDPGVTAAIIGAATWSTRLVRNLKALPGFDSTFTTKIPGGPRSPIDWSFDTTPKRFVLSFTFDPSTVALMMNLGFEREIHALSPSWAGAPT
ncbi:hypothetical protein F5Y14DRAFT_465917 [Nemania sp. NC0429]|nr:hypothetical protein F5Y14DRAFT_465917 [Nemania sp. NC0429]